MIARLTLAFAMVPATGAWQTAVGQTPADRLGCMSYVWGGGWGHMAFGGFMMLVFWAALIAAIAFAVRWVASGPFGSGQQGESTRTARQILEERFARGEIDKAEFEDRKKALSG